jgi:hypothetical protein
MKHCVWLQAYFRVKYVSVLFFQKYITFNMFIYSVFLNELKKLTYIKIKNS